MVRARHLMVDVVLRGVGRLHRSLETTNKKVAKQRKEMIQTLHAQSRLDILNGIKANRLSISQVADAFKRSALAELPTADAMVPLAPAVMTWLDQGHGSRKPLHAATLKGYGQTWRQALKAQAFGASPTVADVTADRVEAYRRRAFKKGHAPQANRSWFAIRSFLVAQLGKRHAQVLAVQDLRRYPELKTVRPSLAPEQFWKWYLATDASARPALMALATTGMMPSELERLTSDRLDWTNGWIRVPGIKTEGRPRIVGVPEWAWATMDAAVPWRMDRSRLQKLIVKGAEAAGIPWARMYDCRRAFARWHEAAGTPESRIRAYMGHSTTSMTDRYLRTEVEPYARHDAEAMGAYLGGAKEGRLLSLVG
jgi:integrase